MSVVGEGATMIVGVKGLEAVKADVVRVSRRDRRLVRTAVVFMAMLALTDAVLYLGQLI